MAVMSKFTHANLTHFLDLMCGHPNISAGARAIGCTPQAVFLWLKRSAAGDEKFLVRWPDADDASIQFAEAVKLARKRFTVLFESQMRSEVVNGIPRVVIHNGEVQYQKDSRFIGWSDEEMIALGFSLHERYLRDADGNAVPLVVHEAAPAHLKIHVSRALIPQTYGDHRSVAVDVNARVRSSVMVIGAKREPEPKVIEHASEPAQAIEGDPLAPVKGDRPDILELKRMARELRDRTGPSVAVGQHGERTIPRVEVFKPEDDKDILDGGSSPRDLVRSASFDPAALPGIGPDGRPATSQGFKVV
jgi:hypothetical protein